jgi:hypothetical protein
MESLTGGFRGEFIFGTIPSVAQTDNYRVLLHVGEKVQV